MASSKVKLEVDATGWDGGLKKAVSSVQQMERECRKVNGTFEVVEEEQLAIVKLLGQMETHSRSVKGRIGELKKAFTDLTSQYTRLTDEEKNSPFGKAMEQSIGSLKKRIQEGNKELQNIQGQLRDTDNESKAAGGGLRELAEKFGLNLGMMAKFASAGAAVSAALKVAKDAFFASEANIDAWGRTMESASSVYEGFLTAINTGDISGYLSRIEEIKTAAYEAYNELDRLGTQKAINNDNVKGLQTETMRMQMMLRTGRYIAPTDGRAAAPGLKTGDKLTKEQLEKLSKNLEGVMEKTRKFIEADIKQTTKSIEALYKKEALNLGMTKEQFKAGTADMATFDSMMEGYANYKKYQKEHTTTQTTSTSAGSYTQNVYDGSKNPYEQYKAWGVFKDDGATYTKINQLIDQRAAQESQMLSQYGQSFRGMNRVERMSSGGGSVASIKGLSANEKTGLNYGNQWNYMSAENVAARQAALANKKVEESLSLGPGTIEHIQGQWNKLLEGMQLEPIPVSVDVDNSIASAKKMEQSWGVAASAISKVGGAMSSLNEPALNIATMLAETIATLGLTYAQTLAKDKTSTSNIWAFIAAAAASTISLAATVASYKKSMNSYADGGVIKGGAYTGDAVPIMANAGEIVLNASMASNLASNLQSNIGGGGGRSYISGEQIVTVVNSYGRRTGRGEILR